MNFCICFCHNQIITAQRSLLIASAFRLFGPNWFNFSQKIQVFMYGSDLLDQDDCQTLLLDVQSYILNTKIFCSMSD